MFCVFLFSDYVEFVRDEFSIPILFHFFNNFDLIFTRAFIFLLQNVPPPILLRLLREHQLEWADSSINAYSATAIKAGPCSLPVC